MASAYERRALGIGSHCRLFDQWGRFLAKCTTTVSLLDQPLRHSIVIVTEGEPYLYGQTRTRARHAPARSTATRALHRG